MFALTMVMRLKLVTEASEYRLDILRVSSTRDRDEEIVDLPEGWELFCSGVDSALPTQAGVGILVRPQLIGQVVEWIPLGGRIGILKLNLEKSTLVVLQVYEPNESFLLDVEARQFPDNFLPMGDFNAHVGDDAETWRGAVGRNGGSDWNQNEEKLLDFCCVHGMATMNTFFQHKDIHKYTWHRDTLGQKSIIDFIMVLT